MWAGWHARFARRTFVLVPTLALLAACAASRGGRAAPGAAAGGTVSGGAGDAAAASDAPDAAAALELERQRNAALQQQLDAQARQTEQLRGEVDRLRDNEDKLRTALERAGGGATATSAVTGRAAAGSGAGAAAGGPGTSDAAASHEVALLRADLAQEQQRREAAENSLAKLKEETSTPAYGGAPQVPQDEFFAVKQEVVDLRRALAAERDARDRLAEQMRNPPANPPPAPPVAAGEPSPDAAELEARIHSLEQEKQSVIESFNRSLAASQQRVAELEQQLEASRTGQVIPVASADPQSADAIKETTDLRAQLAGERKHAEDLSAKLKVAMRITDLIFKMQAQQVQAPARAR